MEAILCYIGIGLMVIALVMRRLRNRVTGEYGQRVYREILEWVDTGYSAIFMAAFIMYFFVQAFKIPSSSMSSTLAMGDHLFVNKFIYGTRIPWTEKKVLLWKDIARGDIVIFRFPATDPDSPYRGKDFIKRVIGLPGDTVVIRNKAVFINGERQVEEYSQFGDRGVIPAQVFLASTDDYQAAWESGRFAATSTIRDNFGPVTVPDDHYFVMGDNRDFSFDSRFWGPLPFAKTRGKAWLLYWPFTRVKLIR